MPTRPDVTEQDFGSELRCTMSTRNSEGCGPSETGTSTVAPKRVENLTVFYLAASSIRAAASPSSVNLRHAFPGSDIAFV